MADTDRKGGMPADAYKAVAAQNAKTPSATQMAGYQNIQHPATAEEAASVAADALGRKFVPPGVAMEDRLMPPKVEEAVDAVTGAAPRVLEPAVAPTTGTMTDQKPSAEDVPPKATATPDETGNFPGDAGYEDMRAKQWADAGGSTPTEKSPLDGFGKVASWLAKTAPGVLKGVLTAIGDYNAGRGGYPELTSTSREQAQTLLDKQLANQLALKNQDVALAKYLQSQEPTIAGQTANAVLPAQLRGYGGMLNLQYGPDSPFYKYLMGQGGVGTNLAQQYMANPQAALSGLLGGQTDLGAQQAWKLPNSTAEAKAAALPTPTVKVK